MEIIKAINGVFWGWLIAGILLSCGIFYTAHSKSMEGKP